MTQVFATIQHIGHSTPAQEDGIAAQEETMANAGLKISHVRTKVIKYFQWVSLAIMVVKINSIVLAPAQVMGVQGVLICPTGDS